jgi:hypothetical protein
LAKLLLGLGVPLAGLPAVLVPASASAAIYCRLTPECKGVAALTLAGKVVSVGHSGFSLRGNTTSHLPLRVAPSLMGLIRRDDGVRATLTATVAGKTVAQIIDVKIL